ncbi:hypothetical protein CLV30_12565 [Haloactinopolyspora alba]|uniref:Uncharacterized protein n=1 Tax=Haloactinopolyspora alba TaxID=648780 RepID=A0A2P8DHK3_9ACTN|nr:hypothetical protein [Haloactinopolyspora alba]PSK96683.1 hypothetical protein CLV30_12565 [Haloactinopolyspora alba]
MKIVGVDPGPVPGIVALLVDRTHITEVHVAQCSPVLALDVVKLLLDDGPPALVAVEKFVVRQRAARSRRPDAGEVTRELIGAIADVVLGTDDRMVQRPAAAVKPWATDERLDAAGLLTTTKGMRHARDAARHALYAAVRDGGLPDPLSRKGHA